MYLFKNPHDKEQAKEIADGRKNGEVVMETKKQEGMRCKKDGNMAANDNPGVSFYRGFAIDPLNFSLFLFFVMFFLPYFFLHLFLCSFSLMSMHLFFSPPRIFSRFSSLWILYLQIFAFFNFGK